MNGIRLSLAIAWLLPVASCVTTSGNATAGALTTPVTSFIDGSPARVDLLARKLLAGAEPPDPGFAFYCYLVFADRASATAEARYGAAAAYLSLLDDVAEIGPAVDRKHMAVLFAPITNQAAATEILRTRDVERFLASYGYARALQLVNQLERSGHRLPRVAIVGYATPLESTGEVDPRRVSIVSLDVNDGSVTEGRLLRLRDELRSGSSVVNVTGEPVVLEKLRGFFAAIGNVLDELEPLTT